MGFWYSINLIYFYPFLSKKLNSGIVGDFMVFSDRKNKGLQIGDLEYVSYND